MADKNIIQKITDKEMDRKTFLKFGGLAVLSVVGLKSVVSLLTQSERQVITLDAKTTKDRGFGSGKYGA